MIRSRYGIPTASTGAMFRAERAAGSDLGRAADALTSRGQFVPDDLVVTLVRSWLEKHDGTFLFDGFPRTIAQADAFERLLDETGKPLDLVLSLDADLETLRRRVSNRLVCSKCGAIVSIGWQVADAHSPCPECGGPLQKRADDTAEVLEQRMLEYKEKTEPLIGYYRERRLLRSVAADRDAEEVFADIIPIIEAA